MLDKTVIIVKNHISAQVRVKGTHVKAMVENKEVIMEHSTVVKLGPWLVGKMTREWHCFPLLTIFKAELNTSVNGLVGPGFRQ